MKRAWQNRDMMCNKMLHVHCTQAYKLIISKSAVQKSKSKVEIIVKSILVVYRLAFYAYVHMRIEKKPIAFIHVDGKSIK